MNHQGKKLSFPHSTAREDRLIKELYPRKYEQKEDQEI